MQDPPTTDTAFGIDGPRVVIEGQLPARIADLWSVGADLKFVADCCDELLVDPPTDESDPSVVRRALWEAAVIAYGRCYRNGKGHIEPGATRFRIPDTLIDQLDARTPGRRTTHDAALASRDQHIAHRVSVDEQVRVVAFLAPAPLPRKVDGVMAFGAHLVEPMADAIAELRDLVRTLREIVASDLNRLLERARELGDGPMLDQMYADAAAAEAMEQTQDTPE